MNTTILIIIGLAVCAVLLMLYVKLYRTRNSFRYYNTMWMRTVKFMADFSSKEDLRKMLEKISAIREEIESGGVEATIPPSMLNFTEAIIRKALRKKE